VKIKGKGGEWLVKLIDFKNIIDLFVEITAQLPCSYSTLGCYSLVDLLPWECCRLYYGKV